MNTAISRLVWAVLSVVVALIVGAGCDQKPSNSASTGGASAGDAKSSGAATVELSFVYGSEKQNWIDAVTADFNGAHHTLASGAEIHVNTVPMGSGESKDDILAGRLQADVWSPASSVFVTLANAESQTKGSPLVGQTQELVLSPVVIAMWKPMAEALGWPNKPLGWGDIIELSKNRQGWGAYNLPQFGRFKFGHTHPEYSNSGLISILAEAYAATGKQRGLTLADLADPKTGDYVQAVEKTVVHYGRSTGFFGKRLADSGPQYLSAAVVYENMVIESYQHSGMPLVAIYPKEGTIWSDHPVAVVERPWVTAEKKEAAKQYIDFLRAAPQQQKAVTFGFRPAEGEVGSPIDTAHGVDPKQPNTVLELPGADVTNACIQLWKQKKKPSNVALVFDKSGSMADAGKMPAAKQGARELINLMSPADRMTLVPFSTDVSIGNTMSIATDRQTLLSQVDQLYPDGNTNLFEAVREAYQTVAKQSTGDEIDAIVVLTDGENNGTAATLDDVLRMLRQNGEGGGVRVFSIGYGDSASLGDLKRIAKEARGEFYTGDTNNIITVFRDIATFF